MQQYSFDTLVIGSGLAGLTAAYYASFNGSVALITKSQLDTSNSYYAQGGIAAATTPEDSPDTHMHDTLVAGRGLCEKDAVKILVEEGPELIQEVIRLGMQFDKKEGNYILGLEGGHSKRRILHADGDATGRALTCFMLKIVKRQKTIRFFEYTAATQLIMQNGVCAGIQALDFVTTETIVFQSRATILATGGVSRVYDRSTNPHTATGDGIALAWEAGAQIADMEFIQFHPSALYAPGKEAFLISEAVRGEGAWLLNPAGERFMKEAHPLAELAPRDVVAFSIYQQMQRFKTPNLYLSLKHLDPEKINARFGNISQKLAEMGYSMTNDLLPVAPAAHYMVGGIKTDLWGETTVPGLFACGEVASTGVMGANRLASNSLLECLVFGKRVSTKASERAGAPNEPIFCAPVQNDSKNEERYLAIKNEVANMMSNTVGIVREATQISGTIARIEEILQPLLGETTEYNLLKAKQTATVCLLIAKGALLREESRGGHIRGDFPVENPDFCQHIIQQKNQQPHFLPLRK